MPHSCSISGDKEKLQSLANLARHHGYQVHCAATSSTPSKPKSPKSPKSPKRRIVPMKVSKPKKSSAFVSPPKPKPKPKKLIILSDDEESPIKKGAKSPRGFSPPKHMSDAAIEKRLDQIDKRAGKLNQDLAVRDRVLELRNQVDRMKKGPEKDAVKQELFILGGKIKIGENPRMELMVLRAEAADLEEQLDPKKKSPRKSPKKPKAEKKAKAAKKRGGEWTPLQKDRLEKFLTKLHSRHDSSLKGVVQITYVKTPRKDFGDDRVNRLFKDFFRRHPDGHVMHSVLLKGHMNRTNNSVVEFSSGGTSGGSLLAPFKRRNINVRSQMCVITPSGRYRCNKVYNLQRGGFLDPTTGEPRKRMTPMMSYRAAIKNIYNKNQSK